MNLSAINELSLNWVDWIILGILTFSTLLSLWRGFAREALSLAAWVLAFVAARLFADSGASLLTGIIDNETARYVAACVVIFVGVLVLGTLVTAVIAKLIKLTGLSLLDRILGTVFGFTRGLIIVLVIVFVVQELLPVQNQRAMQDSAIMPHLKMIDQWVRSGFAQLGSDRESPIAV
ncbi:MAG: membrane protein required for colicin V production [Halioglobus sp.]